MNFNVLLVDDHALFRSGLALILKHHFENITVLETEAVESAIRDAAVDPHIILLDHQLSGIQGIEGITLLKAKWPGCAIVVVSAIKEAEVITEALDRGAVAFVPKSDSAERIMGVVEDLVRTNPPGASESRSALTARQLEILRLLETGLANKAIANKLDLSEFTVRGHVQAIIRTFNVTSRSAAVFEARKRGLLS